MSLSTSRKTILQHFTTCFQTKKEAPQGPDVEQSEPGSNGFHLKWTRVHFSFETRFHGFHLNPVSHARRAWFQGLSRPVCNSCFSRTKLPWAESTSFTSMGSLVRVLLRPPTRISLEKSRLFLFFRLPRRGCIFPRRQGAILDVNSLPVWLKSRKSCITMGWR